MESEVIIKEAGELSINIPKIVDTSSFGYTDYILPNGGAQNF